MSNANELKIKLYPLEVNNFGKRIIVKTYLEDKPGTKNDKNYTFDDGSCINFNWKYDINQWYVFCDIKNKQILNDRVKEDFKIHDFNIDKFWPPYPKNIYVPDKQNIEIFIYILHLFSAVRFKHVLDSDYDYYFLKGLINKLKEIKDSL